MTVLCRLSVFVLLALWLTATQHCGLEAAGLWKVQVEDAEHTCCAGQDSCDRDGCEVVESGSLTASNPSIKVPAPVVQDCVFLLCACLVIPDRTGETPPEIAREIDRASGWVPTWQFERRAAQSPRAPSSYLA